MMVFYEVTVRWLDNRRDNMQTKYTSKQPDNRGFVHFTPAEDAIWATLNQNHPNTGFRVKRRDVSRPYKM